MDGYISNKKKHIFCGWSRKILQAKVTCNTRSKSGGLTSLESPRETPPPRSKEYRPHLPLILGRSFLKTIEQSTSASERSCSTSMAWGVHSSQPWFEVCNMIHVKYILPHHRIGREKSMENEAKKIQKLLHSSRPRINALLWRPKKWLSRRINLHRSQG
jgi:hypothetical protein